MKFRIIIFSAVLLTTACQKEITGPVNGLADINVLYAKLDDVSGAIVDSKNSNNGIGTSVIYGTKGKLNTAISASNTLIDFGLPSVVHLTHKGSISVWINQTSSGSVPLLVSSINYATDRDGYSLGLNTTTPYFELADGKAVNSLTFTSNITNGAWYHLVVTWDGTTIRGYVNGVAAGTASQTLDATHNTGLHLTLCEGYNGTDYFHFSYNGIMDEFGLFNDALTTSQVALLYGAGAPLPFSSFN